MTTLTALPDRRTAVQAGSIRLDNLTVSYNRVPAVHHLSGRFAPGSLTAIVGPNGAGKSTLLNAIIGAVPTDEGMITVSGVDRHRIGYLPQRANIDQTFPISVYDTVALGLWHETGMFGRVTPDGKRRVHVALAALGLAGLEQRPIGHLSVGQFQRVLFARLMLQDAGVILLDEPFAGLDMATTSDLLRRLADWHAEGRTVVAVLHDLAQVRQAFPETLLLSRGRTAWGPSREVLTSANLSAAGYIVETLPGPPPAPAPVAGAHA
jgi:zinc/manganese transport system ATP-binding protein